AAGGAGNAGIPEDHRRVVRGDDAADSRSQRLRRGDRRRVGLVRRAPGARRAAALLRVPPGLQDARRAPHSARDAAPRPPDRPRARAQVRLHRQRARSRRSDHHVRELWRRRRRAGLVRHQLLRAFRCWRVQALRCNGSRPVRRAGGPMGRAPPAGDDPTGEDSVTTDRPPAVAGAFYPADPAELASTVDKLLDTVDIPDDDELAKAYVVPHAGYRYSGSTAAHVYARLRRHAVHIGRIVLVGPAHRVRLTGCAAPTTARWLTPLGPVTIERARDIEGLTADDAPHAPEHSLEVQLPFLQRAVPGVSVLPIAVGVATVELVVDVVGAAAPGAVVLRSEE